MRLAILADIHGNLPALEAVLADAQRQGVEGLVVAGDTSGGPQQREAYHLLYSLGAWLIRGNGEGYCLALDRGTVPDAWWTSYQWAFMRWSYQHLDREALDFIAALPEQRVVALDGTAPVRVVHGSPASQTEHLFPDRDSAALRVFRESGILPPGRDPPPLDPVLAGIEEPVLVCGHSHIPWQQVGAGRLAVNAGSVGAPNDGDWRARYALLTWRAGRWQAEQRAVAYDLARTRAAWRDSGLLAEGGAFARACLLGIETGRNVPGWFVRHVYRLAAEAGWAGGDVVPDEVWEEAVETFEWESHEWGTNDEPIS
jgi:protein phosphatase